MLLVFLNGVSHYGDNTLPASLTVTEHDASIE